MADHCAVTVPLSDIDRIQIYVNTAKKSLASIRAETGANYIINGTLFNMRTYVPNCHLRADGVTMCSPAYNVYGYAWDVGPDISLELLPNNRRNYIACTPLIINGKPLDKLTYDAGQGGKRGRSAIGIKNGRLAMYCTRDGGSMERTPEALRDDLTAAGWDSAVMLDGGGSSSCWFNGDSVISDDDRKIHDYILVYLKKEAAPMGVKTYSVKSDGSKKLSENFKVSEFKCNDGSDKVLISDELVTLLQKIRDHFGAAVVINSAYRTETYNQKVGGATHSQHVLGTAADIVISGVSPLQVAQYAEYLQPKSGGIGVYTTFTHVDVRTTRSRWDNRSGKEVVVSGWPGYTPPAEPVESAEVQQAQAWAEKNGIMTGYADGEMHLDDPVTRRQLLLVEYRMAKMMGKA